MNRRPCRKGTTTGDAVVVFSAALGVPLQLGDALGRSRDASGLGHCETGQFGARDG
jgi:hypothetical protein